MDPTVTSQSKGINVTAGLEGERENRGLCQTPLLTAVPFSLPTLQVQYGLTDEVRQLEGTIRALGQKLAESQ